MKPVQGLDQWRATEIAVEEIGHGPDPWGGYRAGFIGTVVLDRRDFGIGEEGDIYLQPQNMAPASSMETGAGNGDCDRIMRAGFRTPDPA